MCFRLPKVNISGFVRNDSLHRFNDIYGAFLCERRHYGRVKVFQQIESLHFNHHSQNRPDTDVHTDTYTINWQQRAKARWRKSNRRLVTLPATTPMRHTHTHLHEANLNLKFIRTSWSKQACNEMAYEFLIFIDHQILTAIDTHTYKYNILLICLHEPHTHTAKFLRPYNFLIRIK